MKDFFAIDFEAANKAYSSICSMGIVIVRNGECVDEFYSLVKPVPNYYHWYTKKVHGLGPQDTNNAPTFAEAWMKIAPKLEGLTQAVAHGSIFEERCLKAVFKLYKMRYPNYKFSCTLNAAIAHFGTQLENHKLQTVAEACGYHLEHHHNALEDAEACAAIALKIL